MTKETLKQLSKDALEELGRTKGIELDKRYSKAKLVKEIAAVFAEEEQEVVYHQADTNKDGVVSAEEKAAWEARFMGYC
jgi:hypothetical protein